MVRITDGADSPDEADTSVSATLAFRLPAWAGGEAAADTIRVEGAAGSRLSREVRDGYLYLTGEWRDGDTVTFDFPMPVRMLAANPNVREDAGKVAFMRGPVTYCAEGIDNGAALHLVARGTLRRSRPTRTRCASSGPGSTPEPKVWMSEEPARSNPSSVTSSD